jgi:hypothetical protein
LPLAQLWLLPQIWGTKNPRADFISVTRLLRAFVKFAVTLSELRRLSKLFLVFFFRKLRIQQNGFLPAFSAVISRSSLPLFQSRKERVGENTLVEDLRKSFFGFLQQSLPPTTPD